jgi:hypothetical protein
MISHFIYLENLDKMGSTLALNKKGVSDVVSKFLIWLLGLLLCVVNAPADMGEFGF